MNHMIERKVSGTKVVISSERCGLEIMQLEQGHIVVSLAGRDDGEMGRLPFDELDHLLQTNAKPEIFVDTSAATAVSMAVMEQWKNWLAERRQSLSRVHILTKDPFFLLTARIMRELSHMREQIEIYSSDTDFKQAMTIQKPRRSLIEKTVHVLPLSSFSGNETFAGGHCKIQMLRLRPGVLFLRIYGFDDGESTNSVLAALSTEIESYPGKTQIFVEASETTGLLASVSEAWTSWIREHHLKIQEIVVLSGNRLVSLIISAAKIFSRTGELMTVVDQKKRFYTLLEKAIPSGTAFIKANR